MIFDYFKLYLVNWVDRFNHEPELGYSLVNIFQAWIMSWHSHLACSYRCRLSIAQFSYL